MYINIEIKQAHIDNVFWIYTQIICHKKKKQEIIILILNVIIGH